MREFELIDWIRTRGLPGAGRGRVKVGPGDDCAVLAGLGREQDLLLKTDGLVEGVHFDRSAKPGQVGYKAVCRALSDIAASGGEPVGAVVFAALNRKHSGIWAKKFQKGLARAAGKYGCPIVGGDVSCTPGPTTIATGLLGKVGRNRALLRSNARPGDGIYVTGRLGGSILGRHLRFTPRLSEGLLLQKFHGTGAVMDISDGLAQDLGHILKESGKLGAELTAGAIPISAAAKRMKGSPLLHALNDGEDYELLFTIRAARENALKKTWKLKSGITRIGRILKQGAGTWIIDNDNRRSRLKSSGWQHLR